MPPKKNIINTDKKVEEPVVRRGRRAKPPPPPLKVPTVIRINPVEKQTLEYSDEVLSKQRHLDFKTKLHLANEVAKAQLVSNKPVIKEEPKQNMARKGRVKKIVSEFFQDTTASNKEVKEPKAKPRRRVWNRKAAPVKTEVKEKAVPKKRQADSTVKKPTKRQKISSIEVTTTDNIAKRKVNISSRITRRSCKGKQADVVPAGVSPSILAGYIKSPEPENVTVVLKKEIDALSPVKEVATDRVAGPIGSRKASLNSNTSSGPSWIRDISSTSTTTCITVSSNEYIRFNNKVPMIKLTNIDSVVDKYKSNSVDDSSSSDSEDSSVSEHKYSEQLNTSIEVGSLDSVKLSESTPNSTSAVSGDICGKAMDKLISLMKKFDMEIINWLSFDKDDLTTDMKGIKAKIFDILNNEFGIINHCQHLKRILDPENTENNVAEDNAPVGVNKEAIFLIPNRRNSEPNGFCDNTTFNVNAEKIIDRKAESSDDRESFTSDKFDYVPFNSVQGDDDDAISIFAESITGLESSKVNNSIASMSDFWDDEYIPQPAMTSNKPPDKYTYYPTKITDNIQSVKTKIVCEKQNADSTSIYKETIDQNEGEINRLFGEKSASSNSVTDPARYTNHPSIHPSLIARQFRPLPIFKGVVLKGVCFFNLINSCKKDSLGQVCRFPHAVLDPAEVSDRLSKINEELFIQEYMTLRNWPALRRKYGVCFVNECVRRELTRILVEMALDFYTKTNMKCNEDLVLRVNVLEIVLLYLNNVDLGEYEDLLLHQANSGTLLCDVFMMTIAVTQNFSRFKSVFIKLVSFMVANERTFDITVSGYILERVCILPYEEPLAKALVEIIKRTNRNIFQNSRIGYFEKQICSKKEIYEEYLSAKRRGGTPVMCSPAPECPRIGLTLPVGQPPAPPGEGDTPAQSPDTTNLDNMNKKAEEPIITRTIDFTRIQNLDFTVPPPNIFPSCSYTDGAQKVIMRSDQNWKKMSPYPNMRRPQFNNPRSPRPMMSYPMKRPPQRLVTYAETPVRYMPRRPGPNF